MSESKETKQEVNKLMVDDYDIIVTGKPEEPYYQIKYHEVGSEPDKYDIGFGSHILGNVFEYRDEYVEVVPEDETKREVTNEQIMYHLKSIERAQGCVTNGIATLFSIMCARKDILKLQPFEITMLRDGMKALTLCTNNMAEISGLNEKVKKVAEREKAEDVHVGVCEIKDVGDFLDFLKEILK